MTFQPVLHTSHWCGLDAIAAVPDLTVSCICKALPCCDGLQGHLLLSTLIWHWHGACMGQTGQLVTLHDMLHGLHVVLVGLASGINEKSCMQHAGNQMSACSHVGHAVNGIHQGSAL